MADPGGVVGALSLALQVVQGINKYYTQLKCHNDDVANIVSRTRRLHSILRRLQQTATKLDLDDDPLSNDLRDCIEECVTSVNKLDCYRRKCDRSAVPIHRSPLMETASTAHMKLAYPFKKTTLDGIQVEVDRTLENLKTILHVLHMSVYIIADIRRVSLTSPRDTALSVNERSEKNALRIRNQLSNIEANQSNHTSQLHAMDLVSRTQLQNISKSALRVEERLEAQQMLITSLVSTMQQMQVPLPIKGVYQMPALNSANHVFQRSHYELEEIGSIPISNPTCLGCCYPKKPKALKYTFAQRFALNLSIISRHRRNCPLYDRTRDTATVVASVVLPSRRMQHYLEAAFRYGAGSISAQIISRNIVSWDSPAFRLVGLFRTLSYNSPTRLSVELLPKVFWLITESLSLLFAKGRAGPRDMAYHEGNTLMHVS